MHHDHDVIEANVRFSTRTSRFVALTIGALHFGTVNSDTFRRRRWFERQLPWVPRQRCRHHVRDAGWCAPPLRRPCSLRRYPLPGRVGVASAATPPADAPPVSLIGDSTMAGMAWNSTTGNDPRDIVGNSYRLTFDAESCRRLVSASCRGRFGTAAAQRLPLMRTTLKGRLGEAMVVMAGYDDASITNAVDAVMAEAEAQGVKPRAVADLPHEHGVRLARWPRGEGSVQQSQQRTDGRGATPQHPEDSRLGCVHRRTRARGSPPTASTSVLPGAVGLATFIKNALDAEPSIGRCRLANA